MNDGKIASLLDAEEPHDVCRKSNQRVKANAQYKDGYQKDEDH